MKLTLKALLGAACLAVSFVGMQTTATATPITGELDFGGSAFTDTGKLSTAKRFTSFANVIVLGNATGAYSGIAQLTPVKMNGFTFNPTGLGQSPLWTVNSGGLTYEFDLTKVTSFVYNASTTGLTVRGIGIVSITGETTTDLAAATDYTPTAGAFTFSTQSGQFGSTLFAFSSATSSVPDSGTTVALLGLSLVAVEGTRRALNTKRAVRA